MKMRFHFEQELRAPFEEVVLFFRDVTSLKRVSPSFPRIEVVAPSTIVSQGSEFLLTLDFGLFAVRWVSVMDMVGPEECSRTVSAAPPFASGGILTRFRKYPPARSSSMISNARRCGGLLLSRGSLFRLCSFIVEGR